MLVPGNRLWLGVLIFMGVVGCSLWLGPVAWGAFTDLTPFTSNTQLLPGPVRTTKQVKSWVTEGEPVIFVPQSGSRPEPFGRRSSKLPGGLDPMDVVRIVQMNRNTAGADTPVASPLQTPDELGPPFHIGGTPLHWAADDEQRYPAVAFDGNNYLVVWHDNRSGAWDIYGARVNLSATVIDPAGIEISTGHQDEQYPSVAFDGTNYLVVWQDNRGGLGWDIYGARVATSGAVLDANGIAVSAVLNDQSYPSVTYGGSYYLVVWQDRRSGSTYDIYGTRVDQSGSVIDTGGIAISEAANEQSYPDVASDGSDYLAVWQDGRSGSTNDIFGARVDQSGSVIDDDGIAISEAANDQSCASVAFGGSEYMVVWQDNRSSSNDVFAARVDASGTLVDPTGIAISTAVSDQLSPDLAFDGTNFMAVWHDYRNSATNPDIYGARVTTLGNVLDLAGIAVCTGEDKTYYPALASGGTNYFVLWGRERSGYTPDIYGARVGSSGTVLDPCGVVISKSANNQHHPAVAFGGANYLVVWLDHRLTSWKIYCARVDTFGVVLDPSGIPLPASAYDSSEPSVAFDGTNYLVVWADNRSGYGSVYGARVSLYGKVIDPGGKLISVTYDDYLYPSIAFGSTDYLVVWEQLNPGWGIYGALVDTSVAVLPPGIIEIRESGNYQHPCVAFDGTNYMVAWHYGDIQATRVNTLGSVMGPLITVSSATGDQRYPNIAFDGTNYMVVWQDTRNDSYHDVYGTRVTPDGVVRDPEGIPISTAADHQTRPAIAFGGTDYLVAWHDKRSGSWDTYGARVDTDGTVLDPNGLRFTTGINYELHPALCPGPTEEVLLTYSAFTSPPDYGSYRIWGNLFHSLPKSPDIKLDPEILSVEIFPASRDTLDLKIVNNGTGNLSFSIAEGVAPGMRGQGEDGFLGLVDSEENDIPVSFPLVDLPWISEVPTSGVVLPRDSVIVEVRFNSVGMVDSTYGAYIVISSNDEDEDPSVVPTVMEVSHVFLTSPSNGDTLTVWQPREVGWVTAGPGNVDSLNIFYSIDGGLQFDSISHGEVDDSSFAWTVPNTPSGFCKARIEAFYSDGKSYEDVSDGLFTIYCGTVDAPVGRTHLGTLVELWQNQPNPFSLSTDICFYVPVDQEVSLELFDAAGRLVSVLADGRRFKAGVHTIPWDGVGRDGLRLSSGVYFYRLRVGDFVETKKLVIAR